MQAAGQMIHGLDRTIERYGGEDYSKGRDFVLRVMEEVPKSIKSEFLRDVVTVGVGGAVGAAGAGGIKIVGKGFDKFVGIIEKPDIPTKSTITKPYVGTVDADLPSSSKPSTPVKVTASSSTDLSKLMNDVTKGVYVGLEKTATQVSDNIKKWLPSLDVGGEIPKISFSGTKPHLEMKPVKPLVGDDDLMKPVKPPKHKDDGGKHDKNGDDEQHNSREEKELKRLEEIENAEEKFDPPKTHDDDGNPIRFETQHEFGIA
jgi:hypothetical protein